LSNSPSSAGDRSFCTDYRAPQFQPLRGILSSGVGLGFGSDAANVDPSAKPFLNIMIAST
jgi:predicted amidohydrolase YtcJ